MRGKGHKINNVARQTGNTIIIYNETLKEAYIDKQKSSNSHSTD